nr:MAG TPA: hypothetical protein [Caudoviricetes sp.]
MCDTAVSVGVPPPSLSLLFPRHEARGTVVLRRHAAPYAPARPVRDYDTNGEISR